MKFHLVYTDNGSITQKSFKTNEERLMWLGQFSLEVLGNEDSWVDVVFDGEIVKTNSYIRVNNESA